MSRKNTDTRTRILNATCETLASGGSAARMSDIAKAAGISRQALYLHFPSRAELLIGATRHLDELNDVATRLAPSRAATTGAERLDAYIEAWARYIPQIWPVARALLAMMETDAEASAAWNDRMTAMRHGCAAAVSALAQDGMLRPELSEDAATDLLWTLLSVRNWHLLCEECNWSQDAYVEQMKALALAALSVA